MKKRTKSAVFAEKHSALIAFGLALSLAGFCLAADHFELLPLQGAAMPMYGTMQMPTVHKSAAKGTDAVSSTSPKKQSLTEKRRALRQALLKQLQEKKQGSSSSAR